MIDPAPRFDPEAYRAIDPAGYRHLDPDGSYLLDFAASVDLFRGLVTTAVRRFCIELSEKHRCAPTAYDQQKEQEAVKMDLFALTIVFKVFNRSMDNWWDLFRQCDEDWEKFMVHLETHFHDSHIKRSSAAREMASEAIMMERPEIAKAYTMLAEREEAKERDDLPPWRR